MVNLSPSLTRPTRWRRSYLSMLTFKRILMFTVVSVLLYKIR